jgi:uncharacterized repeat protein (TIGR03803 family)
MFGHGTVFIVDLAGNETVLHSFNGLLKGGAPLAGVVRDSVGNLYGTASSGGGYRAGVVFGISPSGAENVLYTFTGGSDGGNPRANLLAYNGSLYGTTIEGGTYGHGVVFKITLH